MKTDLSHSLSCVIVIIFYWINSIQCRLVSQTVATWNLARISQRKLPNHPPFSYIYDDRAGEGVTVYVLDTGVDTRHSEFDVKRATLGKNFVTKEPNEDLNGHGTGVAGVIGGRRYGVAKKSKIVSVKVSNKYGRPLVGDIIAGVNYVVNQVSRAHRRPSAIINIGFTRLPVDGLVEAVDRAVAHGIPVVVPAGESNEDACLFSPSNSRQAVVVGASDRFDRPLIISNHGECVNIYAPGAYILTAGSGVDSPNRTQVGYGTSFAAAHVAGVAAVMMSVNPSLTPENLVDYMYNISQSDIMKNVGPDTVNRLLYNRRSPYPLNQQQQFG